MAKKNEGENFSPSWRQPLNKEVQGGSHRTN